MSTHINGIPLVIELSGQLEEQMFQYVFGKVLLQSFGSVGLSSYALCYDVSNVKKKSILQKGIVADNDIFINSRHNLFSVLGEKSDVSISTLENRLSTIKQNYANNTNETMPYIVLHENVYENLDDNGFAHTIAQSVLENKKPILVQGLWQRATLIREYLERYPYTFELPSQDTEYRINEKKIKAQKNSVSIHMRKSNYIEVDSNIQKTYPPCTMEYYILAVSEFLRRYPDAHFFIFTDDAIWMRKNFISQIISAVGEFPSTVIVSGVKKVLGIGSKIGEWEELFLTNECTHHILANTAFSWWGAGMLSIKRVSPGFIIAPSIWHVDRHKTYQILLSGWATIDR